MFEYLVEMGVEYADKSLESAIELGDLDYVKLLMEKDVAKNLDLNSALEYAISIALDMDEMDIVNLLKTAGAEFSNEFVVSCAQHEDEVCANSSIILGILFFRMLLDVGLLEL